MNYRIRVTYRERHVPPPAANRPRDRMDEDGRVQPVSGGPSYRRLGDATGVDRLPGRRPFAFHGPDRLRLRAAAVPAVGRGECAQRPPHVRRGQLDRGDPRSLPQPWQPDERLRTAAQQRDAVPPRRTPLHVLRPAFHIQPAVARSRDAAVARRPRRLEQCRGRVPALQQPQGLADAGAGAAAAHRDPVHPELRRVHLSQGPACARRPDGVPARALPALESSAPAAEEDRSPDPSARRHFNQPSRARIRRRWRSADP